MEIYREILVHFVHLVHVQLKSEQTLLLEEWRWVCNWPMRWRDWYYRHSHRSLISDLALCYWFNGIPYILNILRFVFSFPCSVTISASLFPPQPECHSRVFESPGKSLKCIHWRGKRRGGVALFDRCEDFGSTAGLQETHHVMVSGHERDCIIGCLDALFTM